MSNKYLRKALTPAATTETTIYTVPAANVAILSSLRVTNTSASTTTLTVAIYPTGGVTPYFILRAYVLPPNATMDVISGVSMVLEEADVLKVTSSQADSDFYLSYLEVDRS